MGCYVYIWDVDLHGGLQRYQTKWCIYLLNLQNQKQSGDEDESDDEGMLCEYTDSILLS